MRKELYQSVFKLFRCVIDDHHHTQSGKGSDFHRNRNVANSQLNDGEELLHRLLNSDLNLTSIFGTYSNGDLKLC